MTGVITWDVDRGDGVCIEREQPSTVCRSMTQFATFVQPQNVDIAQMGELRSEHLGAFKALNETTNVSPPQGDSTSIVHLKDDAVASDHIGALKPSHIVAASEENDSIVHLADDVIVGTTGMDKQFATGGGELGWWTVNGADFRGTQQDTLIGSPESQDLSDRHETGQGLIAADPFSGLDQGFISAPVNEIRSDNRFVFEPMNMMSSLGGSTGSGLDADGGFQPREMSAVEIGRPPEPKLWLHMLG